MERKKKVKITVVHSRTWKWIQGDLCQMQKLSVILWNEISSSLLLCSRKEITLTHKGAVEADSDGICRKNSSRSERAKEEAHSLARLWDPAYVLYPGWRGRPCHRKCNHRVPPNLELHSDRPPSSDTCSQKKQSQNMPSNLEILQQKMALIKSRCFLQQYLRIQLVVSSNSLGVMMFVSDATEAAQ